MILVAGGTGRLGTLVVNRLIDRGLPVRVLTRAPEGAGHLGCEVVAGDVRDRASLDDAVASVDVVVSAVHGFVGSGRVSPRSIDRDGNANLLDAARSVGADFVLMSIVGAAADSPMELFRMKYAAEQQVLASSVPATIVRSTAFMELWIDLLRQTAGRSGRPLVFGRGDNPINFVSVNDVAAVVELAVTERSTRGTTLEIGGPDNLTFNQLATAVQQADGRPSAPRHIPPAAMRLTAATVGRLKPQLRRQVLSALVMDRDDLTFDAHKIRERYPDVPCTRLVEVLGAGRRSI